MIVIADSTPLISLAAIDRMDILESLYSRVLIPSAVYDEVVNQGRGRPGSIEVLNAHWIETQPIRDAVQVAGLRTQLGAGESEAIVLAREISADMVIMDELAGRRELARRSLSVVGAIGVLQQAKLQGLIPALRPELDGLLRNGFYVARRVYDTTLRQVGE